MNEFTKIVALSEIKSYLRIDHTVDDEFLEELIEAAQEWAEDYCGHSLQSNPDDLESKEPPKKFKLGIRQIVAHWYENRDLIGSGNIIPREVPMMARMIFDQTRRIPI